MNDDDLMPFGKHKGTPLKNIPDDYLLWIYNTGIDSYPSLTEYLKDNLEAIENNVKDNKMKYYNRAD